MTEPIRFGKTAADGGERVVITDGQGNDIDFWSVDDSPIVDNFDEGSTNSRLQYLSTQVERLRADVQENTKVSKMICLILLDAFELTDSLEAYELASY